MIHDDDLDEFGESEEFCEFEKYVERVKEERGVVVKWKNGDEEEENED